MKKQNINSMLEERMSADICTCGELRKAARAVTLLYDNAVKSSGLHTQFSLLQVISKSDSIRISDLAATTLTRNLAILAREGLLKISEGTDHRTRNVTATQKGRGAIARAIPLWNESKKWVKVHGKD
ncbi:MAG: hypothetical protein WA364_01865 [Candidatus Nitrosopolaris sp.]